MPRVELPVTQATRDGITPAETAADTANDHKWNNTGRELIVVRNDGADSASVTFVIPGSVDAQALADRTIAIPAGATRVFGPFPTSTYNQNESGESSMAYIDVSDTDLMFTIYRL